MTMKPLLLACGSALAISACATTVERQASTDPYAAALYTGAPQPDAADDYARLVAPPQAASNGVAFELVSYAGIEGARRAHERYTEQEAEALDGRCEKYVQPISTESLIDIANLCDVKLDTLVAYNPDIESVSYAASGAVVEIPGGSISPRGTFAMATALNELYAVQANDTIGKIAYRLNVSANSIVNANPEVTNWGTLSEGQIIRKPVEASTVVAAAASPSGYAPPAPPAVWEGYSGAKGLGASHAGSIGNPTAHAPYLLRPVKSYDRANGVYPEARLTVDKKFVKPGDSVVVTAERALPGEEVTFYIGDEPGNLKKSQTRRADENGTATATIPVRKKSNMGGVIFGARPESSIETQFSDRVGVVKPNDLDDTADDDEDEDTDLD